MNSSKIPQHSILTPEEFEKYKKDAISCPRVSYYPQHSWFKLGKPLGSTLVASVYNGVSRVIERGDEPAMYKQSAEHLVAIKFKRVEKNRKSSAESMVQAHIKAMRIPYAKIKTPTLYEKKNHYEIGVVMAELKGQTLAEFLFEDGATSKHQRVLTISVLETLQIMREVAWSLLWDIHASGIIHRDVTPANVMIDRRFSPPKARVYDFDFCKLSREVTTEGVGTPLYAPLEALEFKHTSEAVDIFGLGWIFFLLLRGRMPTHLRTIEDVKHFVRNFKFDGFLDGINQELDIMDQLRLRVLMAQMLHLNDAARGTVQGALETVEQILLKLEQRSMTAAKRSESSHSHAVAVQLRSALIHVSCTTKIGAQPLDDIVEKFVSASRQLTARPYDLQIFLSTLRVETLMGEVSVVGVVDAVAQRIRAFSTHYAEVTQLLKAINEMRTRLLQGHPASSHAKGLEELSQSIVYLLSYYKPYAWSLDNLAMIDRKLVKLIDRARPVIEAGRQELLQRDVEVRGLQASVAESRMFRAAMRANQVDIRANSQISDKPEANSRKRKLL